MSLCTEYVVRFAPALYEIRSKPFEIFTFYLWSGYLAGVAILFLSVLFCCSYEVLKLSPFGLNVVCDDPFILHLEQTVHVLRHQWAYSCEKARVELNYSPRSLEEGLTEVLPWLKRSNLIKY